MKNRQKFIQYFDVLELPIDSSLSDVQRAYMLLREVYSTESIVTLPVEEEVSEEDKQQIRDQIDEAYNELLDLFHQEKEKPKEDISKILSDITEFNGASLKLIRQSLQMNLDDMALATKIQRNHLENIEEENFGALPVYVYTRGFVVNYAKYLSLDHHVVADSYMTRFQAWRDNKKKRKK